MEQRSLSDKLRVLADRLEGQPVDTVVSINAFVYSKDEAQQIVKVIGGKWKKEVTGSEDYSTIKLISEDAGLCVFIPRNKVCRKTVTWDCEPLLSPEEEAALI